MLGTHVWDGVGPTWFMNRLTASLLLIVLLVGVLAPAGAALSSEPPHACCVRKTPHCHHSNPDSEISVRARVCARHNCCRPLTASQWVPAAPRSRVAPSVPSIPAIRLPELSYSSDELARFHSGRAPPESDLA